MDPANIQKLDQIEAQLRQQAEAADTGEPEVNADTPTGDAENADLSPVADADAQPDSPDEESNPPQEAPEEVEDKGKKTDSEYSRARKDGERLDRSWKKLEREKAELQRRKEELEQSRESQAPAESAPENHSPGEQAAAIRDKHGNSAREYREAAEDLRARGDEKLAAQAEAVADSLESREREHAQEQGHAEFIQKWTAKVQPLVDAEPQLAEADSPLAGKVKELLEAGPFFHIFEDGFPLAVESAKLHLKAARAAELEGEIARLQDENKKLREATSIGDSNPSGPISGPRKIEEMGTAEAEARLRELAATVDASPN